MSEFHTKIVGVTFPNPDGSSRQKAIALCKAGESLWLVREPDNKFGSTATAVYGQHGIQLGYIGKHLSGEISNWLDRGGTIEAIITELTGGRGFWIFKSTRGVNILIRKLTDPPRKTKAKEPAAPTDPPTTKKRGRPRKKSPSP